MQEQIHGHEVMRMMIEEGKAYTNATLRAAIVDRFGDEVRFYTCSAENMTTDELITFLEDRGKFIDEGQGFKTEPDRICKH